MTLACPTRRGVMTGAACAGLLLASGGLRAETASARARVHDWLLRRPDMSFHDQAAFGEQLERSLFARAGGAYPNNFVQTAITEFVQPFFAASARPSLPWKATVIDNDMPCAWILPGGRLALYKGLIRYIDTADELAAVVAHCMGHAENGHLDQMMREPAFAERLGPREVAAILSRLDGESGASPLDPVIARALESAVFDTVRAGYGPQREADADAAIARLFAVTGHDVARGASIFVSVASLAPAQARRTTCLFPGHDQTDARVSALRASASGTGEWPANPGFDSLKLAFPTRRHYRPTPEGGTP